MLEILGIVLCLYLLVALHLLAVNWDEVTDGEGLVAVLEALGWVLVLPPWQEWFSRASQPGKHRLAA